MLQQAASMCCNRALTTSLEGWHKPPSSDCFSTTATCSPRERRTIGALTAKKTTNNKVPNRDKTIELAKKIEEKLTTKRCKFFEFYL